MSLDLDDRQRAMLREMGVHVWQPASPVAVAAAQGVPERHADAIEKRAAHATDTRARGLNSLKKSDIAQTPAGVLPATAHQAPVPASAAQLPAPARRAATVAVPVTGPTTIKELPAGIAAMTWAQLQDSVAHCQACAMCFGRRAPVLAAPEDVTPCDWLVLGDPPDEAQERLGLPFVEEAGLLLDNMLRAVGVRRFVPDGASQGSPDHNAPAMSVPANRAYLTHVLKCRPALMRAPNATELATCANYLRREIALTQPKVILAMGRFAMQLLLSETPPESAKLPLGKLRGQVWQFAGVPVVVTYPPSYLLRSGQDKGKAWADLCLALDVAQSHRGV